MASISLLSLRALPSKEVVHVIEGHLQGREVDQSQEVFLGEECQVEVVVRLPLPRERRVDLVEIYGLVELDATAVARLGYDQSPLVVSNVILLGEEGDEDWRIRGYHDSSARLLVARLKD